MNNIKSPFMVFNEFMSPLETEDILYKLKWMEPDLETDNVTPRMMSKQDDTLEDLVLERFNFELKSIEEYYGFSYKGMSHPLFQWKPANAITYASCENSQYVKGTWLRNKNNDFTGVIFLSDYNESEFFDTDYECYGGKLEFPSHQFGFNPNRGYMIIFPSSPHFAYGISDVFYGNYHHIKFNITAKDIYLYEPKQFPGNYSNWF